MEILKEYPYLINKRVCNTIIDIASTRLEIAKTVGEPIDGYRTAEYCWLDNIYEPELEWIKDFISKATNTPIENQESIHIVRYTVGGEYKEHHDWFYEDDVAHRNEIGSSGNRTHSFLIYLNNDFEGGETEFPKLETTVQPEIGKGVMWINKQDGICLDDSLHAGLPVTNGEKWILIVWVREKKFT